MWISSNPNLLERNMQLLKINYVFLKKKTASKHVANQYPRHAQRKRKQTKELKKKYRRIVNMKISTNAN